MPGIPWFSYGAHNVSLTILHINTHDFFYSLLLLYHSNRLKKKFQHITPCKIHSLISCAIAMSKNMRIICDNFEKNSKTAIA